ncbi:hypothetical protein LSH36_732g00005 [Paralvinella palmiformis]|uniref:VWFA domain-containing protein n=1 Tax=Paralvinella palmiformis TaxID=53620 RepID=A0AAD9J353_9ANNE|nr:hypothetical protein LSH36_732g00005 [Paralvinella palmiformis]
MASNFGGVASTYVLLYILSACARTSGEFPDFGVIQDIAADIQKKLRSYLDRATGFDVIQKIYEAETRSLDLQELNGDLLVKEMAANLSKKLEEKSEALKIEDVAYVDSKNINSSDPAFQFDEKFLQVVGYENSSIHIPVEIYKGNIDILNGLAWTSRLDEQWKKNLEEDPHLLWQYFGSQTGLMRNYPANIWIEDPNIPDLYDVRRRPWYTQGISSPKDMLILVDTRYYTLKKTFVQANHWNKQILRDFVSQLTSKDMASYIAAFEFAFEEFKKLDELQNRTNGLGAMCNKVIMFLTDGGTEMPEEVFEKYNSNQTVRIFSYAVGPTANPVAAVRWIACNNKGFFYRIPAMGAIRSTVQKHVSAFHSVLGELDRDVEYSDQYLDQFTFHKFLSHGLAESQTQDAYWTYLYTDNLGLGLMTTVTMPVYNRTLDAANQTILGVMGTDITLLEMEEFTKTQKLGPNGYVLSINTNGYILIHPDLKAKKHLDNTTRIYHYTEIAGTTFSLAVVTPTYTELYFAGRTEDIPLERGLRSLQLGDSAVLLAPWNYCPHFELPENATEFDEFIDFLLNNASDCDKTLLQHLFTDGNVTKQMESTWEDVYLSEDNGIFAFIIGTNGGLTRIYPANASQLMEEYKDLWNTQYYRRSFDYNHWIYTAPYSDTAISTNTSMPLVLASRAIQIKVNNKVYIPAGKISPIVMVMVLG